MEYYYSLLLAVAFRRPMTSASRCRLRCREKERRQSAEELAAGAADSLISQHSVRIRSACLGPKCSLVIRATHSYCTDFTTTERDKTKVGVGWNSQTAVALGVFTLWMCAQCAVLN